MLPAALGLASSLGGVGQKGPSSATSSGGTITFGDFSPGLKPSTIALAAAAVGLGLILYLTKKK